MERLKSFSTWIGLVALLLCTLVTGSQAQTPNPYTVRFTVSPDHNVTEHGTPLVDRYELVYRAPGSSQDSTPINLGKPTPTNNNVQININTQMLALPASTTCNVQAPTPATCYMATVRVVGPGGVVASTSSPFALIPRAAQGIVGTPDVSR